MLFSILIANYNSERYFEHCFQSILQQTYKRWEVILVDDGSIDHSVEIIKRLIAGDDRFKIFFNEKNQGCGFTKNKCASLAKGEILGFLDPDDALKPNALEIMVEKHVNRPEAAIITSKYEVIDNESNFVKIGEFGAAIPEGKSYLTFGSGAMTHFATFKKKNVFKNRRNRPKTENCRGSGFIL